MRHKSDFYVRPDLAKLTLISKHKFALLAGLNVLLGLAVFIHVSPRMNDSLMEVDRNLKDLQPKFDWTDTSVVELDTHDKLLATRKWNDVQWTHQCCGVRSPADWLPYRPIDSPGEFPVSCCFALDEKRRCMQKNVWNIGCVPRIEADNAGVLFLVVTLIFMNSLMSIMGFLISCCRTKPGYLAY